MTGYSNNDSGNKRSYVNGAIGGAALGLASLVGCVTPQSDTTRSIDPQRAAFSQEGQSYENLSPSDKLEHLEELLGTHGYWQGGQQRIEGVAADGKLDLTSELPLLDRVYTRAEALAESEHLDEGKKDRAQALVDTVDDYRTAIADYLQSVDGSEEDGDDKITMYLAFTYDSDGNDKADTLFGSGEQKIELGQMTLEQARELLQYSQADFDAQLGEDNLARVQQGEWSIPADLDAFKQRAFRVPLTQVAALGEYFIGESGRISWGNESLTAEEWAALADHENANRAVREAYLIIEGKNLDDKIDLPGAPDAPGAEGTSAGSDEN